MSRPRPGFYSTIEYIGPRPQKPKRRNFFGGWVILVIALGMGWWFGKPYFGLLAGPLQGTSTEQAATLSASLNESAKPADKLAAAVDPAPWTCVARPDGTTADLRRQGG